MANAERGKLYGGISNFIVTAGILIEAFDRHVVTNVLHVDLKSLVPDGGLSSSLLCSSPELLLASAYFAIGVHLAEGLRVSC